MTNKINGFQSKSQDPKVTPTSTSTHVTAGQSPAIPTVVAGPTLPFAVAALATVAPILPVLGVTGLRDDSTESDQSLTYSQSHSEVFQRFM